MTTSYRGKYLVVAILITLVISCKKDDDLDNTSSYTTYNGEMRGLMNGKPWHATGYNLFVKSNNMLDIVCGVGTNNYTGQSGRFSNISLESARTKIYNHGLFGTTLPAQEDTCYSIYYFQDHDLILNDYYVDEAADNFFEVNSYDKSSRRIDATLQVRYYRNPARVNYGFPDTLVFSDVHFTADLPASE